jgi:hypothetical protein
MNVTKTIKEAFASEIEIPRSEVSRLTQDK